MKTTLLILMILFASAAFGQTSGAAQGLHMAEHPLHAEVTPLASEHPLVGGGANTYTVAQGERPLWEFGPVSDHPERPLGDVARDHRKEKQAAKKAEIILEKQGS